MWDNGATTETIPDDGLIHTVDVDCECEGGNATYYGMQRTVYADQDREYCVLVFGANTGNIYEGCVFIPGESGCEDSGGGLGYSTTESNNSISKNSKNQSENNLSVSPNPFHDILQVNFDSYQSGKADLTIYSITGQELLNEKVGCVEGMNIYTLESQRLLTSGVMLLQVTFPSGQKITQRIIQINNN